MTRADKYVSRQNDGCNVAPHCADCPLPVCRFDNPSAYLAWKKAQLAEFGRAPFSPKITIGEV